MKYMFAVWRQDSYLCWSVDSRDLFDNGLHLFVFGRWCVFLLLCCLLPPSLPPVQQFFEQNLCGIFFFFVWSSFLKDMPFLRHKRLDVIINKMGKYQIFKLALCSITKKKKKISEFYFRINF